MLLLTLTALSTFAATIVQAAPQNDPTPDEPSEVPEQPSTFDKSWEIIIIVVFVVLISGLIGVCVWVRLRRRRRNASQEKARGLCRKTSPYRNFARVSSTTEVSKADAIRHPLPAVTYDRRSKESATLTPTHSSSTYFA